MQRAAGVWRATTNCVAGRTIHGAAAERVCGRIQRQARASRETVKEEVQERSLRHELDLKPELERARRLT